MPPSRHADDRLDAALLQAWPLPAHEHVAKRERGTELIIGGSDRTPGAVMLAGTAALRAGAGRLQIATAPGAVVAIGVAVPEAMVGPIDDAAGGSLAELVGLADAVVVGPGILDEDQTNELLALTLERAPAHAIVVVDAGGIDALPANRDRAVARNGGPVITPTRRSCRRCSDGGQAQRRPESAVAARFGAAVICFDCVAGPDGRVWIDPIEVSGLGTSGAGDVLAGTAGGAGARCHDAAQAACWAALTHRIAARRLAELVAPVGYLARQLVDEVAPTLAELAAPPPGSSRPKHSDGRASAD